MGRPLSHYDLLEAFTEDGCAICRLGLAAVHRSIEAVNYESVGDPGIRAHLRASMGFCNVHAYQWLKQAFVLGTAQIYVDVLTRVGADLRTVKLARESLFTSVTSRLGQDDGRGVVEPDRVCPVCQVLADTEQMLVRVLVGALPEAAFSGAYAASGGLCLPHLRQALRPGIEPAVAALLRDVAIAREQVLLAELQAIIRHFDYRFRDEPVGPEHGAVERAVRHVTGAPGIVR
jgi:hypothetical protein